MLLLCYNGFQNLTGKLRINYNYLESHKYRWTHALLQWHASNEWGECAGKRKDYLEELFNEERERDRRIEEVENMEQEVEQINKDNFFLFLTKLEHDLGQWENAWKMEEKFAGADV